jgi:apolipoprotein D and lipocalin family protein
MRGVWRALCFWALGMALLVLASCTGVPDGVQPVRGFDIERYLGTWYEIARLDHRFERGLSRVTADYSLREEGGINVINRGYDAETAEWKEVVGKAFPNDEPGIGRLKVSFFGPFYGGYNIIALDDAGYQYSMVCGPDRSYLWILARTPALDSSLVEDLVARAAALGFSVEELIFVEHESATMTQDASL